MSRILLILGIPVLLLGLIQGCGEGTTDPDLPFWKGNTHTHTLWSDGNAAPEQVAAWFRDHDYQFLVLSDHNLLSEGERWFPIDGTEDDRLRSDHVVALRQQFGEQSVTTRRENDGSESMKLLALEQLRQRFEQPGRFLFLQGEEITDSYERASVHVNAFPLAAAIPPQHGDTLVKTLQNNFDAVAAHAAATGQRVIAHLNHPNDGWSLRWEDFAAIRGERLFEVYNGFPAVGNKGDADHPSTEVMWDLINTARLRDHDMPLLFGVATDDSHHYHRWAQNRANPGRGWIQVRAAELTASALTEAIDRGDFYASTGVELVDFRADAHSYEVEVRGQQGVQFLTEFIGTRGDQIGTVLSTSKDLRSSYTFAGDELFVRVKITSNRAHPAPSEPPEQEVAWLQPVPGPGL